MVSYGGKIQKDNISVPTRWTEHTVGRTLYKNDNNNIIIIMLLLISKNWYQQHTSS
jgi:hypothetical protein